MNVYEKLMQTVRSVREKTDFVPDVALILGSGLGALADEAEAVAVVPYGEIEGFPVSTVAGHSGRFVFGYLGGVRVAIMQGRVHYYEGYDMSDVVLPVRLLGMLGAKKLFITNASGGINASFKAGDFMIIKDHISLFIRNPLIGKNFEELGTRFPDMTHAYDEKLIEKIRETSAETGVEVKEGVYAQLTGPSFESPAEIQLLGKLGVDAVGMSTVCETIAANHMGMRVCAISCVCNLAAGISPTPLSHDEVQEAGRQAAPKFKKLITASLAKIAKDE